MPDIDIGQLSEVINNKMDRDLNNRSTDSGLRRLIESYHNGTEWYKVFEEIQSDGTTKYWCEQGGYIAWTGAGEKTVNFYKNFSSAPLCMNFITDSTANTTGTNSGGCTVGNLTSTSMTIRDGTPVTGKQGVFWEARGYIS